MLKSPPRNLGGQIPTYIPSVPKFNIGEYGDLRKIRSPK